MFTLDRADMQRLFNVGYSDHNLAAGFAANFEALKLILRSVFS